MYLRSPFIPRFLACAQSLPSDCFFVTETSPTDVYTYSHTLSLHDALPISPGRAVRAHRRRPHLPAPVRRHDHRIRQGRRPAHLRRGRPHRPRSEEHTSELQSLMRTSYAVFSLKKKKIKKQTQTQVNNQSNY